MLQISRKFEYGLHAVTFLAVKAPERVVTVKEIADEIGFSQEFLSKAMQSLKRSGIVISVQGVKGGYRLAKSTDSISLADIALAIEGEPHLVRCGVRLSNCEISSSCQHRGAMTKLQKNIQTLLASTSVSSLLHQAEQ
ncbi:MAG: Rrf2 family transcriptional regulator [Chlorobiaceae bacterium]|nr:Rrf2 family transcriptional regulator [Chlorobiaceae bacterium]NTW11444.1 Rrf2 family transcriptional regulator [Chlorobiaceae bacterium]